MPPGKRKADAAPDGAGAPKVGRGGGGRGAAPAGRGSRKMRPALTPQAAVGDFDLAVGESDSDVGLIKLAPGSNNQNT